MTVAIPAEKTALQIHQFEGFQEDPIFNEALTSLKKKGKDWEWLLQSDCEGSNSKKTMDTVFFHNDRFEVVVDARGFRPEDLRCSLVNNVIEVTAKRQQPATDGGQKALSMTRTYQLPQQIRPELANCALSTEGILLISAPWNS